MLGGISRLPVDFFQSHNTEDFHWEVFGVSKEILAAKILFGWEKRLSRFSAKIFRLILPKNFIRNSSVFRKNSGSEEFVWMRKGDNTFSGRIVFVSHYRKLCLCFFRCFTKLLAAKMFPGCEGDITFFRRSFFGLILAKTFIGNSSVFQRNCRSENFVWMREGDITFFRRNILNHSTGEIHWQNFVVSETFWYGKKNMNKTGV